MKAISVYVTLAEFSNYIKERLSEKDLEETKDCTWTPLKIEFDEHDMCVKALIVPVKNDEEANMANNEANN